MAIPRYPNETTVIAAELFRDGTVKSTVELRRALKISESMANRIRVALQHYGAIKHVATKQNSVKVYEFVDGWTPETRPEPILDVEEERRQREALALQRAWPPPIVGALEIPEDDRHENNPGERQNH